MRAASIAFVACSLACSTSMDAADASIDTYSAPDAVRPDAPIPDVGLPPDLGTGMPIPAHDGGYAPLGTPTPFAAANETWVGVTIEGSACANGSPYVVAVNLTNRSNDLFIYFQGGGACYDGPTCFDSGIATHVNDTLTPQDVVNEAQTESSFVFQRASVNPFGDMNYLYLPYCTADVFSGSVVTSFTTSSGAHTIHFEGARDVDLVLARAVPTWPSTTRVVMMGVSAGGYGVLVNWWRVQAAFPNARVDAISDSGLPVQPPAMRWQTFVDTWGIDGPPDCPTCTQMTDLLPYYARTMTPPHRFGLLAYLEDAVIPIYYGVPTQYIHDGLLEARNQMDLAPNQRSFFANQAGHVLALDPDILHAGAGGPTVRQWIRALVTDDPSWAEAGP